MRTIIVGGPKTGKTTLAQNTDKIGFLYHTDDLIPGRNWAAQGDAAFEMLQRAHEDDPEGFAFEGCLSVRALSRWLKTQPDAPCDRVVVLTIPKVPQSPEQQVMAKGILTQFSRLVPELRARGVQIEWDAA